MLEYESLLARLLPVIICLIALVLDRLLGEPKYHPLIFFGKMAHKLERQLNHRQAHKSRIKSVIKGVIAVLLLITLPTGIVLIIQISLSNIWLQSLFNIFILYLVIGWQSMRQHTNAISTPLMAGDLTSARQNLAMIVSRETTDMTEQQIVNSTIESVLENGHDCVFASLFWFLLLGPAATLMHRLSNTLDAMWGYKNQRYLDFGKFAARLDDLLGYIPARLTALSYAIAGSTQQSLTSWYKQIGQHKSPNAGLVMASGAGALGITIGGNAVYDGVMQNKPHLGSGAQAQLKDIPRSIRLIQTALGLWLVIASVLLWLTM